MVNRGTEGGYYGGYVYVCTEENLDDCGLGTITRTWTAYDCYGNMSTESQTVTIFDETAPVITGVEEDYTVDCPDELVWSEPTATDACDSAPSLMYEDVTDLDDVWFRNSDKNVDSDRLCWKF